MIQETVCSRFVGQITLEKHAIGINVVFETINVEYEHIHEITIVVTS